MYGQTQKFPLFVLFIGSFAVNAVAFVEISSFAHFVLYSVYGPTQNSYYFTIGLAHWL